MSGDQAPVPRLGNYELLMLLASGGMANVYAARQVGAAGFQRLVVVKRVHTHLLEDRSFYDMFRDEAAMASLVRHPNVVPVTDVVEAQGELFLVMDYIEGVALSTVLKSAREVGEPLPPAFASRMVQDTLAGLHAAHEAVDMTGRKLDIVHRDVSPHNVLAGADGICRLIDFGVAKAAHRATQTRSGALKGKYPYMSPEHARGGAVDRRSDIFSAAIVLFETLAGKRLFLGENDLDTLRRIMDLPIPDISSVAMGVPRAMDPVLRKALERDVDKRYQTAQDFLAAAEKALPPAPHRDVSAFIQHVCRPRLTERRVAIQALLEGKIVPLSVRQARPSDDVSKSHHVVRTDPPPGSVSLRTAAPSEVGAKLLEPSAAPTLTDIESNKGTLITHDAPIAPEIAPPSRGKLVAIGLAAVVGVAGLIAVAASLGGSSGRHPDKGHATHDPAIPSPSAAPAAPAAPSAAPVDDGVDLLIVADAPIQSVRAAGARAVEITGSRAHVRVARWKGPLSIDAVLASGAVAHATALEGTVGEVHLDPPPAPAPAPTPTVAPKGTSPRGARPGGSPTPQEPPELHPSPYGR